MNQGNQKKTGKKENEDYKKVNTKKYNKSIIKNILNDILGFHKREDSVFWQDFLIVLQLKMMKI